MTLPVLSLVVSVRRHDSGGARRMIEVAGRRLAGVMTGMCAALLSARGLGSLLGLNHTRLETFTRDVQIVKSVQRVREKVTDFAFPT
ncbi:MAG: hypothetical protein NW217_03940 [Hyphomicrobiaceae bacterium]|nr:hypothetical protein [Hyphomicrobiaceae bacterium]